MRHEQAWHFGVEGASEWRLAWLDKLPLLAQRVLARLARQRQLRAGLKLRSREVSDILPPDSAIAREPESPRAREAERPRGREAVSLARSCSPPHLLNPCLHAYFRARLLDADDGPFDDEAVFVGLMLHASEAGCRRQHTAPERDRRGRHGKGAQMVRAGSGQCGGPGPRGSWKGKRIRSMTSSVATRDSA